jgi:hypothetical protein
MATATPIQKLPSASPIDTKNPRLGITNPRIASQTKSHAEAVVRVETALAKAATGIVERREAEHAPQVRIIIGALGLELVGKIVVAVGQAEAILVGKRDHHRRIRVVRGRREREQRRRAEKMEARHYLG